jgi:hypothetical protein
MSIRMEKKEQKIVRNCIIFLVIGIVIGGFIIYGYYKINPHIIEKNVTINEEKPLLLYYLSQWSESANNPNQYLFDGYIYNFGGVEAKDVEITCYQFDSSDNRINSIIDKIGNVASYSSVFRETTMNKNSLSNVNLNTTGTCFITNSSNGINLMKNIPDYTNYFH